VNVGNGASLYCCFAIVYINTKKGDYREAIGGVNLQKCKDTFQMIDAVITEK
jgi:hypothetical protein